MLTASFLSDMLPVFPPKSVHLRKPFAIQPWTDSEENRGNLLMEEIEAPMWVDLTIEAKSSNQDINDEWFHLSHPFHQCSSSQLKSEFSHSTEGSGNLDFDLERPSSPKLPSSVSRSRGKHYRNRKWGRGNHSFLSNKQHPVKILSRKNSRAGSDSSQEIKPKSSYRNLKGVSSLKTSSDCENNLTGVVVPNYSKPVSSIEDSSSLSSRAIKAGEGNSTSSVTSESSQQQQQKALDVCNQTFGRSNGLLSVMRISLRKSCVTRQASRVETNDSRKTNDHKSSSSKSSVGSSSNPGHDVKNMKFTGRQNTDRTPDSRNVGRMSQVAKNKISIVNMSKGSNAQMASDRRNGGKTIVAKSAHLQAAKSKVQYQPVKTKALPLRVNEQGPLAAATKAKDKVGVSRPNRLPGGGKENALGRIVGSPKSGSRDIVAGSITRGQKMKQSVRQKFDRTGLIGSKGKISGLHEEKNSMNATQKVYLR